MSFSDVGVIAGGAAAIAFLAWFFFGPKRGKAAVFQSGLQEATILVKGAYQPNVITVKAGMPVRMKFNRQEATDCSNRVVLPDFGISRALAAFAVTAIDFVPTHPGEYPFSCAMNMYRGKIVVKPDDRVSPTPAAPEVRPEVRPKPSAEERPARAEFLIRGMRSITTTTALEDLLERLEGVERVQVNAATERVTVDYTSGAVSREQMAGAMQAAGYGAEPISLDEEPAQPPTALRALEVADLTRRFVAAVILTVPVVLGAMSEYVGLETGGFAADLLELLSGPGIQLALTTPVLFYSGWGFFRGAYFTLKNRTADMNTLIGIGTGAAYVYSLAATFAGSWLRSRGIEPNVYYETAAVIVTLIILGRLLEARAKAGTSQAIEKLLSLQVPTARVRRGNRDLDVPVEEVRVGELVVVRPGERIPLDGTILEGKARSTKAW